MDIDDVFMEIGEWGRYQKYVVLFILLPGVFPCGFHAYNQLFMAAHTDHWCKIPELDAFEAQHLDVIKRISIPLVAIDDNMKFSQCQMYDRNYSELVRSGVVLTDNLFLVNHSQMAIDCKNGWTYDKSEFIATVLTDWNLVCDRDFYPALALSMFGVAGLIGNYIFGYVQDWLGRRPAFFIYLAIQCVFGIATAFANNFITWMIFRMGVGFTIPAILGTPFVLAIELVGPSKRTLITILSNIAYSMSLIVLAIVVWAVRSWRVLALTTTLPFFTFFLYWWTLPESPRWLISKGRFHEADIILTKMAKANNKSLPKNYLTLLKKRYDNDLESSKRRGSYQYGMGDLFRNKNLCRKTIIITFIWLTNTSVYVGLSYYAPALGGNEFLNFFLAGLVELPTYVFLWPAMDYWGRRWTLSCSMILGGTACLTTFLVKNETNLTLVLYCVGKMGISSSFVVLQLIASEIYPTVVRGLGMSVSSVVGMLGPIIIPLINYLGSDMMILPLLIMGTLLVLGGLSSLALPETLGRALPQTLEDGEKIGLRWRNCCQLQTNIDIVNENKRKLEQNK